MNGIYIAMRLRKTRQTSRTANKDYEGLTLTLSKAEMVDLSLERSGCLVDVPQDTGVFVVARRQAAVGDILSAGLQHQSVRCLEVAQLERTAS